MKATNAGTLEIEVIANIARIQEDMRKMERVVGASTAELARLAKAANDNLSSVGKGASGGIQQYARDITALKAKLDPAWAAQQEFNRQQQLGMEAMRAGAITREQLIAHMRDISAAQKAVANANEAALTSQKAVTNANVAANTSIRAVTASAGQQHAGMQQLSFQIGDVAQQFAMGTPIMTIFAQQGQQVVQAIALMRGSSSGLIGFLAGPWGAAIMGAGMVLGMLIPKLLETSSAMDDVKFASSAVGDAQGILGGVLDMTTGKINTQNTALIGLARAQLAVAKIQSQTRAAEARNQVGGLQQRQMQIQGGMGGGISFRDMNPGAVKTIAGEVLAGRLNTNEAIKRFESLQRAGALTESQFISAAASVANLGVELENGKAYESAQRMLDGVGTAADRNLLLKTPKAARKAKEEVDALAKALDGLYGEIYQNMESMFKSRNSNANIFGIDNLDGFLAGAREGLATKGLGMSLEQASAITKDSERVVQDLKDFQDQLDLVTVKVKDAASAMREAFGSVGAAIGDMAAIMDHYGGKAAANQKMVKDGLMTEAEARKDNARNGIMGMGQLAGAAKNLFEEHSAGYEAMAAAEKAFALVQMANTAVNVAAGAAKMFASLGPFAFPAVAAMVAVMAGLGFSGGSGGGAYVPTAADMQKAQGTGSILGDSTAKSNSISRALELMAKNSDSQLEYSNAMANSLRAIETNIGSLTSVLARGLGLSGKSSFTGSTTTTGMSGIAGGGLAGGVLGAAAGGAVGALMLGGLGGTGAILGGMALGGPIGLIAGAILSQIPIVSDLLNGISKFIFNKKVTYTLIDSGVKFYAATMADVLEGGIKGANYELIQRYRKSSLFGIKISSSTTYSEQLSALDDGVTKQVSLILGSIYDTIVSAATAIGVEGVDDILKAFTVDLGKISTKDLSGSEIQDAVTAVFSKAADDMAQAALPALVVFQKVGEGMFETLTRLAKDYQTIDVQLMSIGKTFGMVGLSSLGARENLISLFGSLDDFVSKTQFYRSNFLTEAQQIAPVVSAVNAELARLGLTGVDSLAGFKSVVDGLDLATESGQSLYAALMSLAPGFKAVQDYQEKQAQAAKDVLSKAYATQRDEIDATVRKFAGLGDSLRSFRDSLNPANSGGQTYAQAMVKLMTTGGLAAAGDVTAMGDLQGVGNAFLTLSKDNASTAAQYRRDVALVSQYVGNAITAADAQASIAQQQLDAVNESINLLSAISLGIDQVNALLSGSDVTISTPSSSTVVVSSSQDGGSSYAELLAEVKDLRAENKAIGESIAASNAKIARILERADGGDFIRVGNDLDTPVHVVTP